jgi:glucosamine 6-phosphate synthetase-like amidotransferase/phosphosugar isomerase protein
MSYIFDLASVEECERATNQQDTDEVTRFGAESNAHGLAVENKNTEKLKIILFVSIFQFKHKYNGDYFFQHFPTLFIFLSQVFIRFETIIALKQRKNNFYCIFTF